MDTKCVISKRVWSVVLAAAGLFSAPLSATLQAQEASQTAQADDVSLSEDGDITVGTAGHYYVNMPVTGTNTLTITADDITDGKGTFKVYDDGGKGGNYSDGCNGTLVLTAPTGYVLQLAGDIYTETVRDKLNIYNNSNTSGTPLLINVSSSSSGTKTDITTVTSLSNVMTIYFSSDNSGNYAGLDLTVIISKDEYTYSESTYCDLKNEMIVGGDIILKKGTYYKYDDGDGDTFVIYSGEIDGNGSVIDMANSGYRAFEIKGSGVTIKNLTIKNANFNGKGGAIYFNQSGTVENCTFIDNEASEDGGAVYFKDRGTVMNCNFTGNKATGDDCYGGAVYFHDNGTVKNCIFTGNSACGAGAVLIKGNGSVTNCDFINNTATTTGGGAIWFGSNGTVKDCNFTGNEASEDGGGVYFDSQSTVTNCNFVNNSAKEGGSIYASNGIVLDWTNATDFIFASSYGVGDGQDIKTADGKRFVAYTVDNTNPESPVETPVAIISGTVSDLSTIDGKMLRPIAVAEPDGQGGTTVSPGYLLSIVPSDITPADKTDSQGQPAPDFTITTGTGDNQVITPYYIYKAGSEGTTIPLSVPAYGQEGVDFTVSINGAADETLTDPAVTGSGETVTAALPWTGTNDVEIRDARYYSTGVKYLEWSDKEDKLVQKTTSTDAGNLTKVYILTGGAATTLDGGWYVVKNHNTDDSNNGGIDAQYAGHLYFDGDTHLIIADGAKMQFGTLVRPIADNSIYVFSGSLAIHAQTAGASAGTLNVFTYNRYYGISSYSSNTDASVTLNGVNVTCYANESKGISAQSFYGNASITINGGIVDFTENRDFSGAGPFEPTDNSPFTAIYAVSKANCNVTIRDACVSLYGSSGSIEVNSPFIGTSTLDIQGGQIHDYSEKGIKLVNSDGKCHVILGWKNLSDYIYTPIFTVNGDISIASGQYLLAADKIHGTGPAYSGNAFTNNTALINGKYLQPAKYTVSAPDNVSLAVTDGTDAVEPVTIGSGDAATPYYIYKEGLTVSASLTNEAMQADFTFKNTQGATTTVTFDDSSTGSSISGANAVTFTLPDDDVVIATSNVGVPSGGSQYLAFVDNGGNIKTTDGDVVILVFKGLQKNATTGAIEAVFEAVDEVPEDLPVIFANKTDGSSLPTTIPVALDNSDAANTLAEKIRSNASPFFMTGIAGNLLKDILKAALTDADGNPLTNSSGFALSQEFSDYVYFVFTGDKFVAASTSAASTLSARRYILAIDKVTLLKLLNGSGSPSPARAASSTSRVWTFPVMVGGNSNGITNLTIDTDSPDNGNWYSIDGRRLNTAPRTKGVYIHKGKVVVVK